MPENELSPEQLKAAALLAARYDKNRLEELEGEDSYTVTTAIQEIVETFAQFGVDSTVIANAIAESITEIIKKAIEIRHKIQVIKATPFTYLFQELKQTGKNLKNFVTLEDGVIKVEEAKLLEIDQYIPKQIEKSFIKPLKKLGLEENFILELMYLAYDEVRQEAEDQEREILEIEEQKELIFARSRKQIIEYLVLGTQPEENDQPIQISDNAERTIQLVLEELQYSPGESSLDSTIIELVKTTVLQLAEAGRFNDKLTIAELRESIAIAKSINQIKREIERQILIHHITIKDDEPIDPETLRELAQRKLKTITDDESFITQILTQAQNFALELHKDLMKPIQTAQQALISFLEKTDDTTFDEIMESVISEDGPNQEPTENELKTLIAQLQNIATILREVGFSNEDIILIIQSDQENRLSQLIHENRQKTEQRRKNIQEIEEQILEIKIELSDFISSYLKTKKDVPDHQEFIDEILSQTEEIITEDNMLDRIRSLTGQLRDLGLEENQIREFLEATFQKHSRDIDHQRNGLINRVKTFISPLVHQSIDKTPQDIYKELMDKPELQDHIEELKVLGFLVEDVEHLLLSTIEQELENLPEELERSLTEAILHLVLLLIQKEEVIDDRLEEIFSKLIEMEEEKEKTVETRDEVERKIQSAQSDLQVIVKNLRLLGNSREKLEEILEKSRAKAEAKYHLMQIIADNQEVFNESTEIIIEAVENPSGNIDLTSLNKDKQRTIEIIGAANQLVESGYLPREEIDYFLNQRKKSS